MFSMNLIYKRQQIIFTIIFCITTVLETRYTSDIFLAAEVWTIFQNQKNTVHKLS